MIYSPSALDFLEFLAPPEGAVLERLICTTYSLSCRRLLDLSAALYLAHWGQRELDSPAAAFPEFALRFRRGEDCPLALAREKLLVFSGLNPQGGAWDEPALLENAQLLFQTCGTLVRPEYGGLFHPKMLLACFYDLEGKQWSYRLQIGSGNLTDSGALDLAVQLEGRPQSQPISPNGGELAPFAAWLYQLRGLSPDAPELAALSRTVFQPCLPSGTQRTLYGRPRPDSVRFAFNLPQQPGCLPALKSDFGDREVYVYSPFLVPEEGERYYLDRALHVAAYHTNLTRPLFDAREVLTRRTFCGKNDGQHLFFHGKLYVQPAGERPLPQGGTESSRRVWLGSANASAGGMERNVELMVGFTLDLRLSAAMAGNGLWTKTQTFYWQSAKGSPEERAYFLPPAGENGALWSQDACFHDDAFPLRTMLGQMDALIRQTPGGWELSLRGAGRELDRLTLYGLGEPITLDRTAGWRTPLADLPAHPPRGVLRVNGMSGGQTGTGLLPLTWDPPQAAPAPPELAELLERITARDLIPSCAKGGFSDGRDSLLARLEAYLASHNGDRRCLARLLAGIDAALEPNKTRKYLPEEERPQAEWLRGLAQQLRKEGV